jgi:hypothetical protein
VRKCSEEQRNGAHVFVLHRAAMDAHWYWNWVAPFAISYALCPRLKFVGHKDVYPFPLMLSEYSPIAAAWRPYLTNRRPVYPIIHHWRWK